MIVSDGQRPLEHPLREAERIEREQPALQADLAARLFPRSQIALEDATVASARAILFTLVNAVEADLTGEEPGLSWPIIERSRLLDHPPLLKFLMAHAAWLRLAQRLPAPLWQRSNVWLSGHIDDDDGLLSESIFSLLSARSRTVEERLSGRYDLPAPIFRHLVRQIDAALLSSDKADPHRAHDVTTLLAAHDEAAGLPHLSARLAVQLARDENIEGLRDPVHAGLDLFAGFLASELGCSWHDIVLMLGEGGVRLMLLLRAAAFRRSEAQGIADLLSPTDSVPDLTHYKDVSKKAARALIAATGSGFDDA